MLQTRGSLKAADNIMDVFGGKVLQSLKAVQAIRPDEEDLSHYGIQNASDTDVDLAIDGFVSSCEHGVGRSSTDRQFYFINSRPCEPNKIAKLVNEIYHQYNRHQV